LAAFHHPGKPLFNEEKDLGRIEWLANRFYENHYNIEGLLTDLFMSDWFYQDKNMGTKIKSPVELLVGIRRVLPMDIQNEEVQLLMQRLLGQVLFYPPNVAGWPGGKSWIDSSTLMTRMQIPQLIFAGDSFLLQPKSDDDIMMGMKDRPQKYEMNRENMTLQKIRRNGNPAAKGGQQILASIHWEEYLRKFDPVQREGLVNAISALVLQTRTSVNASILNNYTDAGSRDSFIKTTTIQLMSTPEYQLC